MEWQKCKQLANQIIAILTDQSFERRSPEEGYGFSLIGTPESRHARTRARTMLAAEFAGELSEQSIQKQLDKLVCHIYDAHGRTDHVKTVATTIQTHINAFYAEPAPDWQFVAVMEKATISEPWDLGNFCIIPGTEEQTQALRDEFLGMRELLFGFDEERDKNIDRLFGEPFGSNFTPRQRNEVVLLTTWVKAKDHLVGRQRALERFEEAINFLRFFSKPLQSQNIRWGLGLYGDVAKRNRSLIGMSRQGGLTQHASAEIFPVDFNHIKKQPLDIFFALASIPPETRSPLEKRIIQAIQWIGQAIAAQDISHQYLFIFTALETIMLDETARVSISQTLAERCAFLIGTELKSRKNLVEAVKDAYDTRSKITHGVEIQQEDQNQLHFVINLAYNCIALVAGLMKTHNWTEQKQLTDYLVDLKFS